jgi:hypothetical protein
MAKISYRRHRFPPVIIQHAVWIYLRFTLRYRDVEELLAERGLDISYETVRCWVLKFGPMIARRLRRHRPRPSTRWHLDEMVIRIAGERMYLWRAVDHEGEVLDMLVQRRRDSRRSGVRFSFMLKRLLCVSTSAGHAIASCAHPAKLPAKCVTHRTDRRCAAGSNKRRILNAVRRFAASSALRGWRG